MRRSRPRRQQVSSVDLRESGPPTAVEALLDRSRRLLRRGEQRRALLTLQQACFVAASDARLWALYGVQCWRMNRLDDAERALRQALWFRERARDDKRACVLTRLLDQLLDERQAA